VREFELEEELAERIRTGVLRPGDRLPGERELAREFGAGRLAIREAVGSLVRRGLVARDGHREPFVTRPKVEHDLRGAGGVSGFTAQMEKLGLEPAAKVLNAFVLVPPATVSEALGLERGARAAKIERIRFASKLALVLDEMWLPDALYPDITELGLTGSMYALMRECYARAPARAVERLEAVAARAPEARLLHVPAGAPLMLVERTSYDEDGTPIEFTRERYRGDRARFVVESLPGD
jgi:GntR family transcriptional regulator